MAETVRHPSTVEPPPIPDVSFSSEGPPGRDPSLYVLIALMILLALTIVAMIDLRCNPLGCA